MRGSEILNELDEINRTGLAGMSAPPERAMQAALRMIAERNNMTEEQARKKLRKAIARRRRMASIRRLSGMKQAAAAVYMSLPESSDVEIKSLFSSGDNFVIIPVEKPFISEVKQFVDGVAEFHNLRVKTVEEGIQIFNTDTLDDSAIEAASNAIHAAFLQVSVEEAEISKALGIKYS